MDVTVDSLLIQGSGLSTDLAQLVLDCTISRTIEACPTLNVKWRDRGSKILRSGILNSRVTMQFDGMSFQLAQVRRSGPELETVFEDMIIAALRTHKDPRKVGAGQMSRAAFVKLLAAEEPWIKVYIPPGVSLEPAKEELARGRPDVAPADPTNKKPDPSGEDREDSWTAMKRIMDDIGWRVFSDGHQLWVAPETWLIGQAVRAEISEETEGIDSIDFDWDVGKPIAQCSVAARAKRWDFPPGSAIKVMGCGPADGAWIVSTIDRSAFQLTATITLTRARPVLPEPDNPPVAADTSASLTDGGEGAPGGAGAGVGKVTTTQAVSTKGWIWPVRGWILSGFGMRNGHQHEGVDIAIPENTKVQAAKDGTVFFAGDNLDYGKVVYVNHPDGSQSRYASLNRILVKTGVQVKQTMQLGESGGAKQAEIGTTGPKDRGSSTQGPHLHFEIRVNDVAQDPMKYLGELARDSSADLIRVGKGHFS
jgi:murein DD-endopeptidase MepM/ murein hydrolase activator NlpD